MWRPKNSSLPRRWPRLCSARQPSPTTPSPHCDSGGSAHRYVRTERRCGMRDEKPFVNDRAEIQKICLISSTTPQARQGSPWLRLPKRIRENASSTMLSESSEAQPKMLYLIPPMMGMTSPSWRRYQVPVKYGSFLSTVGMRPREIGCLIKLSHSTRSSGRRSYHIHHP